MSDTQQPLPGNGDGMLEATPPRVAALLRARTKDSEGREVGLWTEDTRPTVGQVEELIKMARTLISGTVGPPGERCAAGFEQAVVIQAAMLVELSYFPEQVRTDRSPYSHLEELYTRVLEGYQACIAGEFDAEWRPATAFSIRTPSLPDRGRCVEVVNWNDPYADDIDERCAPWSFTPERPERPL